MLPMQMPFCKVSEGADTRDNADLPSLLPPLRRKWRRTYNRHKARLADRFARTQHLKSGFSKPRPLTKYHASRGEIAREGARFRTEAVS